MPAPGQVPVSVSGAKPSTKPSSSLLAEAVWTSTAICKIGRVVQADSLLLAGAQAVVLEEVAEQALEVALVRLAPYLGGGWSTGARS